MKNIVFIHFNPIDKYPPAFNLVRSIDSLIDRAKLIVCTSFAGRSVINFENFKNVQVKYYLRRGETDSRIFRFCSYFLFHLRTFFLLLRFRPQAILYYETMSSFSALIYKKYFNRKVDILIHYHEYCSKDEYKAGMFTNRMFHYLEKTVYNQAVWISHTNRTRMDLFLSDLGNGFKINSFVFPNYPPKMWFDKSTSINRNTDSRIGLVYVGALSLQTMYVKEMATFVAENESQYYWDIYSGTVDPEVLIFLKSLNAKNISFKGQVSYDSLPVELPKYDVGVILYRGTTFNYIFNAPNKFFEYLACGLNVVYPVEMKGMTEYSSFFIAPYVFPLDFSDLEWPDKLNEYRSKSLPPSPYYADDVFVEISKHLL